MAYFYVKSGGTATGDAGRYASQQTGSFASLGAANYYDNIVAAIGATTPVAEGDTVCIADDHSHTYSVAASYSPGNGTEQPAIFISVDVANCDQYSPGATEKIVTSGVENLSISNKQAHFGLTLEAAGDFNINMANDYYYAQDCTLKAGMGTSNRPIDTNVESNIMWVNVDVVIGNSLSIDQKSIMYWYGGTASISPNGQPAVALSVNGECQLVLKGVDLSAITSSLVTGYTGDVAGPETVRLEGCAISASSAGWFTGTQTDIIDRANYKATNCGTTAASAEYQYVYWDRWGTMEDESSIYRDNSSTWANGGAQTSLKVVTTSLADLGTPFVVELPTRYAELSNTASDTMTVYIVSSATLTDSEVWVQALYPDGTNKHILNRVVDRAADIFGAGTTLTTNSETWTNPPATPKYYQIDVPTSGDVGADGVPHLTLFVTKASATFYVCPTIGLS